MDHIGAKLHDLSQRYYLFDWAFAAYPDLAAIILFELRREGEFFNPTPDDRLYPVGYVITNPNLPDAEKALGAVITESSVFVPGIASDPLNDLIG